MSTSEKRFSASTVLIVSAVVGAAAFAAGRSMHASDAASAPAPAITGEPPEPPDSPGAAMATSTALPPGHPPVDPNAQATTSLASATAARPTESSLSWKVPRKWQVVPNASTMRLATYKVGPDAEMAVSQAGGSVDANVERWIGQFGPDAKKNAKVTTKKVSGLDVTIVEVEGTFGGGMGPAGGAGGGGKEDWALLGAIVATPDMPHFFKLIGPAKTVKAARPELDELIASLSST